MKIACSIKLNDQSRDAILKACPEAELIFPATKVESGNIYMPTIVDLAMRDCEVLLGHVNPKGLAESAPNLGWIHLAGAGADHVLRSDLLESVPGIGDPDGSIPRRWFGPDDLIDLISLSDFIVLAPPLTAATRHMIGAREFAAARPTAYLINVARGEVVDQDALIDAHRAGRLSGACLDVTTPEPLNPESPLWEMENVTLTFHTSAARPASILYDFACELFAENLKRVTSGRELMNVIDPQRGY